MSPDEHEARWAPRSKRDPDSASDGDIGGHVDEIARIWRAWASSSAAHAAAVSGRGRGGRGGHVESILNRRGEEHVDVEESHGVGDCVLDEHALGVAGNDSERRISHRW